MTKILQDLYCGRISGWNRNIRMTPEKMAVNNKIQAEKQHLSTILSSDDFTHLDNLESLFCESHGLDDMDTYIHAFKLGALFMCAVFMDNEDGNQSGKD